MQLAVLRSYAPLIISYLPNFNSLVLNMTTLQAQPSYGNFKGTQSSNVSNAQMFLSFPNQPVRIPGTRNVIHQLYTHIPISCCFKLFRIIQHNDINYSSLCGLALYLLNMQLLVGCFVCTRVCSAVLTCP